MGAASNERAYLAKAKSWQLGESSTGKERVEVVFEITTPDADLRTITWYGYFSTEKLAARTVESLRICGWEGDDLTEMEGLNKNDVELVVADEEYEGKTYAKVQWVNRPGGMSMSAPLTGDRAKSFAASMRDRIRAMDAAKGKKAPKPAAAPSGNASSFEEDLPF